MTGLCDTSTQVHPVLFPHTYLEPVGEGFANDCVVDDFAKHVEDVEPVVEKIVEVLQLG